MENDYPYLVILVGLALRLALPILVTLMAVFFLKKLDEHWQAEAERERLQAPAEPQSWDLKECPIEKLSSHPLALSVIPCWQFHRLPNGYLNDQCLKCETFRNAPAPVVHVHI